MAPGSSSPPTTSSTWIWGTDILESVGGARHERWGVCAVETLVGGKAGSHSGMISSSWGQGS